MKMLICGAGALGSHLAYLARDLGEEVELSVIDFDRVETKNLASQWFVKQMVGKNKATAIKLQWQNFFGRRLTDYSVRLTPSNLETILGGQDLVVDCFDNAASRGLVQDFVRRAGIPCVHGGLAANGEYGAVRWDADFVIDSEDTPGQPTCEGGGYLAIIVGVSRALATAVQGYLDGDRQQRNWNVTPTGADSF